MGTVQGESLTLCLPWGPGDSESPNNSSTSVQGYMWNSVGNLGKAGFKLLQPIFSVLIILSS